MFRHRKTPERFAGFPNRFCHRRPRHIPTSAAEQLYRQPLLFFPCTAVHQPGAPRNAEQRLRLYPGLCLHIGERGSHHLYLPHVCSFRFAEHHPILRYPAFISVEHPKFQPAVLPPGHFRLHPVQAFVDDLCSSRRLFQRYDTFSNISFHIPLLSLLPVLSSVPASPIQTHSILCARRASAHPAEPFHITGNKVSCYIKSRRALQKSRLDPICLFPAQTV